MSKLLLSLFALLILSGNVSAAILVMSPNGTYTTKTTLEAARTALDVAGKTVVVTTPLTEAQSNITAAWPADRALVVEKGGSIANSTAFTINGPFSAGMYPVFVGPGTVTGLKKVRVEWFGDYKTDIGASLTLAINSIKATGGTIRLPVGEYTSLTPINLTNVHNYSIKISGDGGQRGSLIYAKHSGPVFDCTGSQFIEFRDFSIIGAETGGTPNVAFLFARVGAGSTNSAGRNRLVNVETRGHFAVTCLYNYASEEFRATDCAFTNSYEGASVVTLTQNNVNSLTSPYTTIGTGAASNTEIRFVGCAISSYGTTIATNTLHLQGVGAFTFRDGFMAKLNQGAYIFLDGETPTIGNTGLTFDSIMFDGTTGGGQIGFMVSGATVMSYVKVSNIYDNNGSLDYALYSATGSAISSWDFGLWYGAAPTINLYSVAQSILRVPYATLSIAYDCNNSIINTDRSTFALTRPDLSHNNTITFAGNDWTDATLQGAWINQGVGVYESAGYKMDDYGVVKLRGIVKSGSGVIFTLPIGYRPTTYSLYSTTGNGAFAVLSVNTAGDVTLVAGAVSDNLSLSSVAFPTR